MEEGTLGCLLIFPLSLWKNKKDSCNSICYVCSSNSTENKVYKIGDIVKINALQLTFNLAKFVEPNEYFPAEKRKVLEIMFNAKNNGKKDEYFRTFKSKIVGAEGNQFKEYVGGENTFVHKDIVPGKQITGKMLFDMQEGDNFTGTYKPTFALAKKSEKLEVAK